jgi:hypothetical protein
VADLADALDSKSSDRKIVWVRSPPPAFSLTISLVIAACLIQLRGGERMRSPEDFLSAFVEEQLDDLFVRRERRKTEKDKKLDDVVRSTKERAKAWSEAVIATRAALEAMRKLVTDGATDPKVDRGVSSDG